MTPMPKKSHKATKAEWDKLREQCFKRDGYSCQNCPRFFGEYGKAKLHPHHIWPKGRLVLDVLDNLLTLCHDCHRHVHDNAKGYPSVKGLIEKYWDRIGGYL